MDVLNNDETEIKYLIKSEQRLLGKLRQIKHMQINKRCSKCGERLTLMYNAKTGEPIERYCGYCNGE